MRNRSLFNPIVQGLIAAALIMLLMLFSGITSMGQNSNDDNNQQQQAQETPEATEEGQAQNANATPAQSATPTDTPTPTNTPTPVPRGRNSTETMDCGMPVHGIYNDTTEEGGGDRTWTLTGDCVLPLSTDGNYLHFTCGGDATSNDCATFTIDGQGHTIDLSQLGDTAFLFAEYYATIVLKNVKIIGSTGACTVYSNGTWCGGHIAISRFAKLEGTDIDFRRNSGGAFINVLAGHVELNNLIVENNVHVTDWGSWSSIFNVDSTDWGNKVNVATTLKLIGARICGNTGGRNLLFLYARDKGSKDGKIIATIKDLTFGENTWVNDEDQTKNTNVKKIHTSDGGEVDYTMEGGKKPCVLAMSLEELANIMKRGRSSGFYFLAPPPPTNTCVEVTEANPDIRVHARYGLTSGVQCQLVEGAGIGIQRVLDMGVIKALDVWAYVDQGVEVCFEHRGEMMFLDAEYSPRKVMSWQSEFKDGWTCANIEGHGTLVLVQPQAYFQAPAAPAAPAPAPYSTCGMINDSDNSIRVYAADGLGSGVQCQQVMGAGIGIQSVLDMGVVNAVDVWSHIGSGVEVCFQGQGKMIFLDANHSPRQVMEWPYEYHDGATCSSITSHGTLVLVNA